MRRSLTDQVRRCLLGIQLCARPVQGTDQGQILSQPVGQARLIFAVPVCSTVVSPAVRRPQAPEQLRHGGGAT